MTFNVSIVTVLQKERALRALNLHSSNINVNILILGLYFTHYYYFLFRCNSLEQISFYVNPKLRQIGIDRQIGRSFTESVPATGVFSGLA